MSSKNQSLGGTPLAVVKETIGIFSLLGVGLGLTGGITISQLGTGGGAGGILGGILIIVVLTFAFLIGPLVAVVSGLRIGEKHGKSSQTYIAAGIGAVGGYLSMMVVVLLILSLAVSTISGDGGTGASATQSASTSSSGLDIGQFIVPVIAVAIPTGITGAGSVIFASDGHSQEAEVRDDYPNEDPEGKRKVGSAFDSIPIKKLGITVVVIAVIGAGVAIIPGIISSSGDFDNSGTTSGSSPEDAMEQYRTATFEGNAEEINEVISAEGDIRQAEEGNLESKRYEVIEYSINEVSVSEYESQTGKIFDEEDAQERLAETGGSNYAIVRWTEEFVPEGGQKNSFEQYYLLHEIDGDWLAMRRIP